MSSGDFPGWLNLTHSSAKLHVRVDTIVYLRQVLHFLESHWAYPRFSRSSIFPKVASFCTRKRMPMAERGSFRGWHRLVTTLVGLSGDRCPTTFVDCINGKLVVPFSDLKLHCKVLFSPQASWPIRPPNHTIPIPTSTSTPPSQRAPLRSSPQHREWKLY